MVLIVKCYSPPSSMAPRKPSETILRLLTLPFLLSTHPRVCMEELFSIQVFSTAIIYRLLCHRLAKMLMNKPRSLNGRGLIVKGEGQVLYNFMPKIDATLNPQAYPTPSQC